PVGRPQSAAELARALQASATPAGARRPRLAPLAGALAAVLVLALGAWRLWPRASEPDGTRGLALPEAAGPGASHAAGFAHSRALLIGIGAAYEGSGWKPLPNAAGDVTDLSEALATRSGDQWEVRTLLDEEATHDGIRTELARLEEGLTSEDRVLIYFAGHGEPHPRSEDSGWLIPSDARRDDAGRTRWVYFDDLARAMKDSPAKHVLLALDCCYGGRVAEQRGAGVLAYKETFTTEPARVVLAAGRANQPVEDGTGKHSTFAEVLLDALSDPHASYTSSELHARLQGAFLEKGLPQQPVLAHLPGVPAGEFVFLGR
ncbi:MAG: caspase family protein, partial [Planctomycetota bacterium]